MPRIEPFFDWYRITGLGLDKCENRFVGWYRSFVRGAHEHREHFALIVVVDLDHVSFGRRIEHLDHIPGIRFQYDPGNLRRLAEHESSLPVPFVSVENRRCEKNQCEHKAANKDGCILCYGMHSIDLQKV